MADNFTTRIKLFEKRTLQLNIKFFTDCMKLNLIHTFENFKLSKIIPKKNRRKLEKSLLRDLKIACIINCTKQQKTCIKNT